MLKRLIDLKSIIPNPTAGRQDYMVAGKSWTDEDGTQHRDVHNVRTLTPEPAFNYRYEPLTVECCGCHATFPCEELKERWEGDEWGEDGSDRVCPKCGKEDCCEPIMYENLKEAQKRTHQTEPDSSSSHRAKHSELDMIRNIKDDELAEKECCRYCVHNAGPSTTNHRVGVVDTIVKPIEKVTEALKTQQAEPMCPWQGTKFEDVPGYVSGYGCPVCKGLSYHLRVTLAQWADAGLLSAVTMGTLPPAVQKCCICGKVGVDCAHQPIQPPLNDPAEPCVPPDACSTHGRCWTHSSWETRRSAEDNSSPGSSYRNLVKDPLLTGADDFQSYWTESVEYPDVIETMMRPGILQEYVGSTYLDGFINHVKPLSAFLVTRYRPHSRNVSALESFHADPPFHCHLGKITGDDVMLLAIEKYDRRGKPGDGSAMYWFFWYDQDCSDCEIGRFLTGDPTTEVIRKFREYAQAMSLQMSKDTLARDNCEENREGKPALEIDVKRIRGWVKG